MICIKCGAKISDDTDVYFCPKCHEPLNNGPSVSDDTKVGWQGFAREADKTVILPEFPKDYPVSDMKTDSSSSVSMKTNPQMEFTPEDFKKFDHFDADGSNPYGIEMPGHVPATEKNAGLDGNPTVVLPEDLPENNYKPDGEYHDRAGYYSEQTVYMPRGHKKTPEVQSVSKPPKEKYFPNGFLQETPDIKPPQRKHKIGVLDVVVLLLGIASTGLCLWIFKMSGGLSLIQQFFQEDMNIILNNMEDITYFSNNLDVTWRLYYEIASMVIITIILATVFIVIHCFAKYQAVGILKAVLLLVTGIGMLILCGGYCVYYVITVGSGSIPGSAQNAGMVTIAGAGVAVAAVIWFIFMCIWGFTSFFNGFHVASMALLALGFVFSFLLIGFNLFTTYHVCYNSMPADAVYEIMSTPAMAAVFMVMSVLAALEDYLAKRIIED